MARLTENAGLEAFSGGVFVPTMGGLHEGHLELVRAAKSLGGPVVVSVFVNPDQFNDQDDFEHPPQIQRQTSQLVNPRTRKNPFTAARECPICLEEFTE